ncbi:MAG TPA: DUF4190 domain-containing protein [Mycobacteriales bacterium]
MTDESSTPEDGPPPAPYVPPPAPAAGSGRPPMPGPYAGGPPSYGPPPGYGPPGYGAPGYGQPGYGDAYGYGAPPPRNGFGVTALVLGIIGLLTSWFLIGVLPGVLAVVFGALGRGRAKRREATNRGMATAGIVLGILAIVVWIAFIPIYIYVHKHCVDVDGHLHCNDPNYPVS